MEPASLQPPTKIKHKWVTVQRFLFLVFELPLVHVYDDRRGEIEDFHRETRRIAARRQAPHITGRRAEPKRRSTQSG